MYTILCVRVCVCVGMYLTDLTFLDLGRKKNGTISTPTTPVCKFADYNKRTTPVTNIQAQVSLFILCLYAKMTIYLRLMQFITPLDIFRIPHMVCVHI